MNTFLFTSESVTEGHPDKLCDRISDAVLDACLQVDPYSKVACETCTGAPGGNGFVTVFGEITTGAQLNYEQIVRQTLKSIGYDDIKKGIDYKTCLVNIAIGTQSSDISQAVHANKDEENYGAGDQGHMFGYATNETEELMPLTHVLSSKLAKRLEVCRKQNILSWLRPDGKTQVTVEYQGDMNGSIRPKRIHTILVSTQHDVDVTNEQIHTDVMEHVIKPIVPADLVDDETHYYINPSGRFVIGGPHGDSGLTGRKIIVDTYGGWSSHGGGNLNGKDCTKTDRSGVYMARWIAVSLVHSGLAERVSVQLSYGIGLVQPLSVSVNAYGTSLLSNEELTQIVLKNFDLRPGMIIKQLRLRESGFYPLSAYGHLGRPDVARATWEVPKTIIMLDK